jgi:hypothetical protein
MRPPQPGETDADCHPCRQAGKDDVRTEHR